MPGDTNSISIHCGCRAQELKKKGVAQEFIEAALVTEFGEAGSLRLRHPTSDTQQRVRDALLSAATKKAELTRGKFKEDRKRLLAGWLQRRGHSWDTVEMTMKELDEYLDATSVSKQDHPRPRSYASRSRLIPAAELASTDDDSTTPPAQRSIASSMDRDESSAVEFESLVHKAAVHFRTSDGLPKSTRQRRLVAWLQRRHKPWPVVKRVLERVMGEAPPIEEE